MESRGQHGVPGGGGRNPVWSLKTQRFGSDMIRSSRHTQDCRAFAARWKRCGCASTPAVASATRSPAHCSSATTEPPAGQAVACLQLTWPEWEQCWHPLSTLIWLVPRADCPSHSQLLRHSSQTNQLGSGGYKSTPISMGKSYWGNKNWIKKNVTKTRKIF